MFVLLASYALANDSGSDQFVDTVESDVLVESIDNGDGTFSYVPLGQALPEIGALVEDGVVTWRYVGQARYAIDPPPRPRSIAYTGEEERVEDVESLMLRGIKHDYLGRVWEVASVDSVMLEDLVHEYDALHPEDEDHPGKSWAGADESPPVGVDFEFEPMSWTNFDCVVDLNGNGVRDFPVPVRMWDGESRTRIGPYHNDQQKGAVEVQADNTVNSLCSGTLIEDSHVLTAAHCVSDSNNQPLPTATMTICRDRSPFCVSGTFAVNSVFIPSGYSGGTEECCGTDFGDDWAVIKLGFPIVVPEDTLALSGASKATIGNLTTTRSFGIPAAFEESPGCTDNFINREMMRNVEYVGPTSVTDKKVRTKQDTTPGQSGAPIYYCPAGNDSACTFSDDGFVYGVNAGYNSFNKRVVGPRVAFFRDVAIGFMDTSPQ